jgi:hypothetical protein
MFHQMESTMKNEADNVMTGSFVALQIIEPKQGGRNNKRPKFFLDNYRATRTYADSKPLRMRVFCFFGQVLVADERQELNPFVDARQELDPFVNAMRVVSMQMDEIMFW